jgi:hypothetical protein
METRNVVFALIGILLLLVGLLVGLWSGCMMGSLVCGCCGFVTGASSSSPQPYPKYPPRVPYTVPHTPTPPRPEPGVPGAGQAGALITDVVPGSPAEGAGLRRGDIIFSVDRQRLEQGQDLARIIGARRPGDEVTLGVWRQGRTEFVRVRLAEHPEERGRGYLGIYFQSLGGQGSRSPHSSD